MIDPNLNNKIVVKVQKMPTSFNKRTVHDQERTIILIRKYSERFPEIKEWITSIIGAEPRMSNTIQLAKEISESCGIHLGRLEKRNKGALLSWFAYNWDKIQLFYYQKYEMNLFNEEPLI